MNVDDIVATIADRVPPELPVDRRFVVAITGPPAAGKSTTATELVRHLAGRATMLGMDAFHFDNTILDARGHRPRKGAPHTFDVASYQVWIELLRRDRSVEYALPVYDRHLSAARNCAVLATPEHDVLVTEGNYLLLDHEPWSRLRPLFDLTVMLDVDLATVEARIRDRWQAAALPPEEIDRRTLENDLPNARLVEDGSAQADLELEATLTRP